MSRARAPSPSEHPGNGQDAGQRKPGGAAAGAGSGAAKPGGARRQCQAGGPAGRRVRRIRQLGQSLDARGNPGGLAGGRLLPAQHPRFSSPLAGRRCCLGYLPLRAPRQRRPARQRQLAQFAVDMARRPLANDFSPGHAHSRLILLPQILSHARSSGAGTSIHAEKLCFDTQNIIDLMNFLCNNEFNK